MWNIPRKKQVNKEIINRYEGGKIHLLEFRELKLVNLQVQ